MHSEGHKLLSDRSVTPVVFRRWSDNSLLHVHSSFRWRSVTSFAEASQFTVEQLSRKYILRSRSYHVFNSPSTRVCPMINILQRATPHLSSSWFWLVTWQPITAQNSSLCFLLDPRSSFCLPVQWGARCRKRNYTLISPPNVFDHLIILTNSSLWITH